MSLAQPPVKGMYLRGKVWWLRYTPTPGSPQARVSLNTESETEAAMEAVRVMGEEPLADSARFKVEVEAYFAEGLRLEKLSDATVTVRRAVLMRFARLCGLGRASDITTAACERWVTNMRRTCSLQTIHTMLTHVRAFCSWLVRKNKLRNNPVRGVELGKRVITPRKNFIPKERVRELIAAAPTDDLRFILFCGFHAGMRKLEIVESRADWFMLEGRGGIHIQRTPTYKPKDKEQRTVPLTAEFRDFLRGYLPTRAGAWMLRGDDRGKHPVYRIFIHPEFNAFMAAQKVRCTLHDMRRSFVSNKLIEDGRLAFKLSKWTGTDLQTLLRHYGHLLTDDADIEAGL